MLNLKCVLDNSKMINLMTGSPMKQSQSEATDPTKKYKQVTLNIAEVSEEQEHSDSKSSLKPSTH